jgi:hypothetical protein
MNATRPLPDKDDFNECASTLKRFGIRPQELNNLDENSRKKLKKILLDLQQLMDLLPGTVSDYMLINWAEVFFHEQELDINHVLSASNRFLNSATQKTNNTITWIYLGLNFIGLVLSIAAIQNLDVGFLAEDTTTTATASSWNYIDTVGSVVTAVRQIYQGEIGLGLANLLSSLQLAGCTITANIAKYTTLLNASTVTIGGLMGFSFAASMLISCCIELYEVHQSTQRINVLETQLEKATEPSKKCVIQKAILIEKAHRENHLRSAKSWAACAIAMTAVAVITYITLSGLTFGALPAATLLIVAIAFTTGLIRKWWVTRTDHVENVKIALKKTPANQSLMEESNTVASQSDCHQEIALSPSGFFHSASAYSKLSQQEVNGPSIKRAIL